MKDKELSKAFIKKGTEVKGQTGTLFIVVSTNAAKAWLAKRPWLEGQRDENVGHTSRNITGISYMSLLSNL